MSNLAEQIREALSMFARNSTEPALIGGLAVVAHQVVRATQEIEEGDGLWSKCPDCGLVVYRKDLIGNASVCSGCSYHHRIDSDARIRVIADEIGFRPIDAELAPTDPLAFKDRRSYADRLRDTQQSTGLRDAVVTGHCLLEGLPLSLGVMDFRFMGGSMGSVVGEKLTRMIEEATERRQPLLIVCASGGPRIHASRRAGRRHGPEQLLW